MLPGLKPGVPGELLLLSASAVCFCDVALDCVGGCAADAAEEFSRTPEVSGAELSSQFREVFEDAFEQEISITQSIKNIAARCHKEQDFVTIEFLNWFLKEQREEEYIARRALELFNVIGEQGTGHWDIDKNIGNIKYSGGE